MCDDLTQADTERFLAGGVTRRDFGVGAAAVGATMALASPAGAVPVKGRDVVIKTPDGECDTYYVAPATGRHPAVLVWPDIMGLRPAFRQMADRLAQSGYAVLTVNQFYRSTKAPFVAPGEGFSPALRDKVGAWRALLTPEATTRDAHAFLSFIDTQAEVDGKRPMASTGYCMGGPMVILTAAAAPSRVKAGATFHGAELASDTVLAAIPQAKAEWLIAIAANDDERAPDDKTKLRAAFAAAHEPAEVEVYPGTMHGWCPPDSKVYNHAEAERAWSRQLALLSKTLR